MANYINIIRLRMFYRRIILAGICQDKGKESQLSLVKDWQAE